MGKKYDKAALVQTVRNNLITLFSSEPGSKVRVAAECGISKSGVTRWISEDNTRIPTAEYLYVVARHFNVTVDWILTEHGEGTDGIPTYAETFTVLYALCRNGTLSPDAVKDPVLNTLLSQAEAVAGRKALPKERKDRYLSDITERFRPYPLPESTDPPAFHEISETVPGVADVDPICEAENLAKIVSDKDEYEKVRKQYKIGKSVQDK